MSQARHQKTAPTDGTPGFAMYTAYIATRTQIYLHDQQNRRLTERSRRLGRTKSALIREAIDAYLAPVDGEHEALARLRAAVKEASGAAPKLASGTDYVEQVRALETERERAHSRHR
jgi:predicted DNA-binding protein